MAKLRRNHSSSGSKPLSSFFLKFTLGAAILLILAALIGKRVLPDFDVSPKTQEAWQITDADSTLFETLAGTGYLPYATYGEVIVDPRYSLAYSENHEQAIWVAYELTGERLRARSATRNDWFEIDTRVTTGSARHSDYTNSGYSRGHLAPAEDFAFDQEAMNHTFLMSNISPQLANFNGGIWRELEELVRDWARANDRLIVVTGPVFYNNQEIEYIGKNRVAVPHAFYKVILDADLPEIKGIGFVIPHASSEMPLSNYATSIRFVEELTGIDFYMDYLEKSLQDSLENNFDVKQWPFDEKKFRKRVNEWNRR